MFIVMNIKMKLGLTKFAIDLNRQLGTNTGFEFEPWYKRSEFYEGYERSGWSKICKLGQREGNA